MTSNDVSSGTWLNLGYKLFSEEGHEGLQIERLARILGKNKSGFYHFFGDKDTFLERLMELHLEREEALAPKFIVLEKIDSQFIRLMVENKEAILFQTQLVKNRDLKLFQETYHHTNQVIEGVVQSVWVKYLGVSEEVSMKYWRLIRDTFYARVTSKTFNQEWLLDFIEEAKSILSEAQNNSASS
ncbi:hypothetical protein GCM10009119_41860 [Algoriphagus jejuensis]|uniref:HTH tetR-type domain-containing protein n=1 Tax=Algoriphagus jejuensis TaxID=419934 RepID=A0ABP3YHZ8_9BACT